MRLVLRILGVVLLSCLVTACTISDVPDAEPSRVAGIGFIPGSVVEGQAEQVQVVAHPDDDLYFMAPDVNRFISHGLRSMTVVVTAAEYNGSKPLTQEQYAASRQDGLRAAYAEMAGVANVWGRAAVVVAGKWVERDTLTTRPQITLVFLNLPDGKDVLPGRFMALENLWKGAYAQVVTLVPTGSPVDRAQTYTAKELTDVLSSLYGAASVTVARTLDSHPDHRFEGDHPDHVYSALFAERALSIHIAATGDAVACIAYRGYGVNGLPPNLPGPLAANKQQVLSTYADHDPGAGLNGLGVPRVQRIYPRYFGPSIRSFHQADGRLSFAATISGAVHVWTSDGNRWRPAVIVDGARLAPALAVSRQRNGRVRLFGIRMDDFHLVTAEQTAANVDAFTGWQDLGNREPTRPQEIGSPESAVDGSGRVYIFVKDFAGGVSVRSLSPTGSWTGWQGLSGTSVTESVTAAVDGRGRLDLYAPTPAGILRWTQSAAGEPLLLQPGFLGPQPAGRISAAPNADGRLQVFYRDPATSAVHTVWQTKDGTWSRPQSLGGENTSGPVSAALAGVRIEVVAQSTTDGLRQTRQSAPNTSFRWLWNGVPGSVLGTPEAGVDTTGRLVIGAVSETGGLTVSTELESGNYTDALNV